MQRSKKLFIVISILLNIFLCYKFYQNNRIINNSTLKIDSLESKINNIKIKRDSVYKEIDTVYVKLNFVKKEYEKIHDSILSNSTSQDYIFFTSYIEQNKLRFDSLNNF